MEIGKRHTLIRVEAGDYLLLTDDRRSFWRLYRYHEDGSAVHLWIDEAGREQERRITGTFWAVASWVGATPTPGTMPNDLTAWHHWQTEENLLRSRRDAMEAALATAERRGN
jgi:hypothetical protein